MGGERGGVGNVVAWYSFDVCFRFVSDGGLRSGFCGVLRKLGVRR